MAVKLGVSGSGYATVRDTETGESVYVHRIAALVDNPTDIVAENDVHHVDGISWINNRDNLQPIPAWDHRTRTLNGDL